MLIKYVSHNMLTFSGHYKQVRPRLVMIYNYIDQPYADNILKQIQVCQPYANTVSQTR